MKHVVMFSSGAGSWAAARRVADLHGTANLTVLFADVKGESTNPHDGEDADNYRFLIEAAADIYGVTLPKWWYHPWRDRKRTVVQRAAALMPQLVIVRDGRTVWDVFHDDRFLGNPRLANCSKFLKQIPSRAWLDTHCDPADTTVYVGIDWTETHRVPAIRKGYAPYTAEAPMTEPPYLDKADVLAALTARHIKPPRLYGAGYAHANCGGFCVRAGQGQFAHLLTENPERYAYHERKEEELRVYLDKDVAILRDRSRGAILAHEGLTEADLTRVAVTTGSDFCGNCDAPTSEHTPHGVGCDNFIAEVEYREVVTATGKALPKVVPLTLTAFRERHEAKPEQTDVFDIGGCGCFVAEEQAAA